MIRHPPRSTLFPSTTLSRSLAVFAVARHGDARLLLPAHDVGHALAQFLLEARLVDLARLAPGIGFDQVIDRKSTRLNSSHSQISYAVFCLQKKSLASRQRRT